MAILPELLFLSFAVNVLLIGSMCALAEHFDLFELFHFVVHSCVLGFTLNRVHGDVFEDAIDSSKSILVSESRLTGGGHCRPSVTLRTNNLYLLLFRLVDIVALFVVVLGVLDEKSADVLVILRHLIQILRLGLSEITFRYLMFGQIFSMAQLSFIVLERRKFLLHVNLLFLCSTLKMLLGSLLDVLDDIWALTSVDYP